MSAEEMLIMLLLPLPIADGIATVFFFRLFLRSQHGGATEELGTARRWRSRILAGRSWLLGLLTLAFAIITLAFVIIAVLAGARIFGYGPIPGGVAMLVLALIFLGCIPPVFMWAFWQSRRRRGAPPPFSEDD